MFSDSDFAAYQDNTVLKEGYSTTFLDETPISWCTLKHKSVSLLTMVTKYVILAEAAKELTWLKNILENKSLNLRLDECLLYCVN